MDKLTFVIQKLRRTYPSVPVDEIILKHLQQIEEHEIGFLILNYSNTYEEQEKRDAQKKAKRNEQLTLNRELNNLRNKEHVFQVLGSEAQILNKDVTKISFKIKNTDWEIDLPKNIFKNSLRLPCKSNDEHIFKIINIDKSLVDLEYVRPNSPSIENLQNYLKTRKIRIRKNRLDTIADEIKGIFIYYTNSSLIHGRKVG